MDITSAGGIYTKRPSKAWYLLPIFFGIVGGFITYYVLKDEDRKMAKKGLLLGIMLTLATVGLSIVAAVISIVLAPHATISSVSPPTKLV